MKQGFNERLVMSSRPAIGVMFKQVSFFFSLHVYIFVPIDNHTLIVDISHCSWYGTCMIEICHVL